MVTIFVSLSGKYVKVKLGVDLLLNGNTLYVDVLRNGY